MNSFRGRLGLERDVQAILVVFGIPLLQLPSDFPFIELIAVVERIFHWPVRLSPRFAASLEDSRAYCLWSGELRCPVISKI